MQNGGIAFGDLFQLFPQETPQLCIQHFAFCIASDCSPNENLPNKKGRS
jgi:hypothetical protein